MIRISFSFAYLFFSFALHAQVPDAFLSSKSAFDSLQFSFLKFTKSDSLLEIKNSTDTLRSLTLKPKRQLKDAKHNLDSLHHSLQTRLDSLTKLQQPDTLATKMLTRIKQQSDSIQSKIAALRNKVKAPDEIGKLRSQVEAPVAQAQAKVNEKLSPFQQNGMTDLPSVTSLPSLPSASLPEADIGNLNLPNTSFPDIKSRGFEVPQVDVPAPSIPNLKQLSLPSVNNPDVGNYSEKIADVTDQVKEYKKEIKDFDTSKLDEIKNTDQWEDKLSELDEMGDVKKQIDLADQAKRYFDPEVAKEEALNKAKQEAINHFAGHEEELKAAMEQLSKLKAKMPDAEGVVDLFAKRKIFTKDSSFMKRFATGLSFQFQKQKSFWIDLNPHVVYKISNRFVAGIGWNERLAYNFDEMQWDMQNHIYGPRCFVHFKFKTNFWLKGEIEIMNSPLRATQIVGSDIVGRRWIASYFGGIKKDFHVSKRLKGHVQMLYNLYNPSKASPYMNRFNVRMGIELPTKKRKSSDSSTSLKPN